MRQIKFWGKMIVNDLFFKIDNYISKPDQCPEISNWECETDNYGQGAIDESQEGAYNEALEEVYDSAWIYEGLNEEGEE